MLMVALIGVAGTGCEEELFQNNGCPIDYNQDNRIGLDDGLRLVGDTGTQQRLATDPSALQACQRLPTDFSGGF
jgi:hypothetical protein